MKAARYITALFVGALNINGSALAVIIAADDASQPAYSNGWQAGDNGGTGFRAWTFAYSGVLTGLFHDPRFIDRGPLSGNLLGAPAFGLTTGSRDFESDTSEVRRAFSAPISVGHTFSVDIDGSQLDPAARKFTTGNTLQLFGADGRERFGLFTNNDYHNDNWTSTGDVDTGISSATPFHVDFTLITPNTYNLALLPIGGGTPLFTQTGAALTGTAGTGISSLRISAYGTGSSTTGTKELFFDNLMVSAPGLNGDYNNDGAVDAADYIVWRKTLGLTGAGLAADGNGNNRIDTGDYNSWRANFDRSMASAAGGAAAAVPESPTWFTASLSVICLIISPMINRRHAAI